MLERIDGETREIAAGLGVRIVKTAEAEATVATGNIIEEVKIVLNEVRMDKRRAKARLEAKVLARIGTPRASVRTRRARTGGARARARISARATAKRATRVVGTKAAASRSGGG